MSAMSLGVTILQNFSPTRSPFYPIAAFSATALVLSCSGIEPALWYYVSIPTYVALLLAIAFCFWSRPTLTSAEHQDQLLFARSLNVSVAILALSLTAASTDAIPWAFKLTVTICVTHAFVFFVYTLAFSRARQPLKLNFVQLALVTMTLLVAVCHCLYSYATGERPAKAFESEYVRVAIGILIPWFGCIMFWLVYALKAIIRIPVDTDPSPVTLPNSSPGAA